MYLNLLLEILENMCLHEGKWEMENGHYFQVHFFPLLLKIFYSEG